jgi:hypothetical protein
MVGIGWSCDLNSRGIIGLQYTTCLERRKRIFLIVFIFLGVPMHVTPCTMLHHTLCYTMHHVTPYAMFFVK